MQMHHETLQDGSLALRLAGELTIFHAAELRQALLALAPDAPAWRVDLGGVTEIDTAGIQVLLAARRMLAARGAALRLAAPSASVAEAFALLGMADAFAAALA